ncbi:AAA family ATPase [Streptomyces albus subsp. chlorinus]|uniref:UvrD-helicase domain-containing protein n=1 Tax=Streptomyces albus TaxID=1888 RepID=UPI00156D80AC|nr:UvrD-helicase domain-containing protein [Streptomyces albus]NSC21320.1 AAA family ATPase [Streptomyces albus subsp. chlorinus]
MAEERCVHGLLAGQCGECRPAPPGLPAKVYVTDGGAVFHRNTTCRALLDGQRRARRLGRDTHDPGLVPLTEALAKGRAACAPCFPAHYARVQAGPGLDMSTAARWTPRIPGPSHTAAPSRRSPLPIPLPEPRGHQRDVVFLRTQGHCVVLGTAGSGKTTMALHRAHFLAHAPGIGGPTLLVTFNRALATSLRTLVGDAGGALRIATYHQFAQSCLRESTGGAAPAPFRHKPHLVEAALARVRAERPGAAVLERPAAFFVDELRWMAGHGVTDRATYVSGRTPRLGRGRPLSMPDREAAFDVYETYLRLREPHAPYDWDDVATAVRRALEADGAPRRYRHVVVDEGQDFTPEMIRGLAAAVPDDGSLTFFADYAQQVYGSRMSWRSLGLDVPEGPVRFVDNHRNSAPIAALAGAAARMPHFTDEVELVEPRPPVTAGPRPTVFQAPDEAGQLRMAARAALAQYGERQRVAVLMPTREHEKRLLPLLECGGTVTVRRLDAELSGWTPHGPLLSYGTYFAAKGLEFDSVVLPLCDAERLPHPDAVAAHGEAEARARQARALYVALTRARRSLLLLHSGQLTDLLPDEMSDLFVRVAA